MSLAHYRQKRDFKQTPEPKGEASSFNGALHFVIHEHHASRLHYDLRLECRGVLKSWAVPKGVSLDPSVKRLAVEVEDHPYDYGRFEGTIPPGNYGAGQVFIWDNGKYYVDPQSSKEENEQKVEQGLRKGHLEFVLQGKRAFGAFHLIRIRGQKKNEWLLIKRDDDQFTGLLQGAMPQHVQPMLATLVPAAFDREGWYFEVKWDGYRLLAQVEGKKVRLYTRNDHTFNAQFPPIVRELQAMNLNALLDGEAVVVDDQGVSRFQLLQNYLHNSSDGQLRYYVFDLLYWNGRDLRGLPLGDRRGLLSQAVPPNGRKIMRVSDFVEEQGKKFFQAAKKMGLEGIIAKNSLSRYQDGKRSEDWLKVKAIRRQEAVICGLTQPTGGRPYFGALILGLYEAQGLRYIGHAGGGFDEPTLKNVYGRLQPLIASQCPFQVEPKTNTPVTWVKPSLVCEVKFQEWTADHRMRQPIFLGLREDKKPQDVHREDPEAPQPAFTKQGRQLPAGRRVKARLTNLQKIYWPQEGYTKGDMIQYYQSIADVILPYLKNRPLSLRRQPDGILDPGFFQKNIQLKHPAWIKTVAVESERRSSVTHYLICADVSCLAYMNNLGCIEINAWMSTVQHPQHPDYLVLDFDPVDIDFDRVIDTVLEARKILRAVKAEGFCKTSGGRGMHIYVPLKAEYDFDQTRDFAQLLCLCISRRMPKLTSLERNPGQRKGLIYLDYLQNHYAATMAVPYSLRPQPGAPVSTPLEWREVKRGLRPQDFNLKTLPPRLRKQGDLWKGSLRNGINMSRSLSLLKKLL